MISGKSMILLILTLAVAVPAFGQAGEDPGLRPRSVYVSPHDLSISQGGLYVRAYKDSASVYASLAPLRVEKEPRKTGGHSVDSGTAVFAGPVRVSHGGIYVGYSNKNTTFGGEAVFSDSVYINSGTLTVEGDGWAIFGGPVRVDMCAISMNYSENGRASMIFQGPVSVQSGFIDLRGHNSAIFLGEVKVVNGAFLMEHGGSRTTVTLGERGSIEAGQVKILGGSRLNLTLSSPRLTQGFITADTAEIDADCLAIDNPDGVVKEGEEIILITGRDIQLHGDSRKIITKQGDEFELLWGEKQISAKLTKRAVTKAVWDDDEGYIGHNWLTFSF